MVFCRGMDGIEHMSAYSAHQYTRTNNPGMISRGPVVLCSAYGVVDQIGERCTQHRTGMRVSRAGSSSSRAGGRKRKRDRACSHYYRTSSLVYPRVGSMLDRADLLSPVWNLNLFKFRSCSELDASSLCGAELPDTIPDYSPRSQHTPKWSRSST